MVIDPVVYLPAAYATFLIYGIDYGIDCNGFGPSSQFSCALSALAVHTLIWSRAAVSFPLIEEDLNCPSSTMALLVRWPSARLNPPDSDFCYLDLMTNDTF